MPIPPEQNSLNTTLAQSFILLLSGCFAGYGAWLHGEAVAAGTMMAADMSLRLGWIDAELARRIHALNEKAKLPVTPPPVGGSQPTGLGDCSLAVGCTYHVHGDACMQGMTARQFQDTMAVDKKVQDGKLRLILLR